MQLKRFLLISVCFFVTLSVEAKISETERNALLSIAQFSDVGLSISWSGDVGTECSWSGVTCDTNQEHVVDLNLLNVGLTELSPEIGQLIYLQSLVLDSNFLTSLPDSITVLKGENFADGSSNGLSLSINDNCLMVESETSGELVSTLSEAVIAWLASEQVTLLKGDNAEESLYTQKNICTNPELIDIFTMQFVADSDFIDFIDATGRNREIKQAENIAFSIFKEGHINRNSSLKKGVVEQINPSKWRIDTQNLAEGKYEIVFWIENESFPTGIQAWNRSFEKISNESSLKNGHDLTSFFLHDDVFLQLDLDSSLFAGKLSLFEQIKQIPGLELIQQDKGLLYLIDSNTVFGMRPLKIEKSSTEQLPGYYMDEDGLVRLKTANKRTIKSVPVLADPDRRIFKKVLEANSLIQTGYFKDNGVMLFSRNRETAKSNFFIARPSLVYSPARISNEPGIYFETTEGLTNIQNVYYVFYDAQEQLMQQALSPAPFYWDNSYSDNPYSLKDELSRLGFSQIKLAADGMISVEKNNRRYRGYVSYNITDSDISVSSDIGIIPAENDLNGDGYPDFWIITKRFDLLELKPVQQALFMMPAEAIN